MLKDKIVSAVVSLGIIAAFTIFVILAVATIFPYIESPYYFDYYNYYSTQGECESAGSEWLVDEYGGYCQIVDMQDAEYDRLLSEYDTAFNERETFYGATIILIALIAVFVSLFYIKNKIVSDGFFGGSQLLLFTNALSTNIVIILVSMLIILGALIFIATKKLPKKGK